MLWKKVKSDVKNGKNIREKGKIFQLNGKKRVEMLYCPKHITTSLHLL